MGKKRMGIRVGYQSINLQVDKRRKKLEMALMIFLIRVIKKDGNEWQLNLSANFGSIKEKKEKDHSY